MDVLPVPSAPDTAAHPPGSSAPEQLRAMLRYAVLAPSGHNAQPWQFKLAGDSIELYADRTRALPVVDPNRRALIISCGAALFNLRIASRHFGYEPKVALFPDPGNADLLARVRLVGESPPLDWEEALFNAIPQRHTNRSAFEDRPVAPALLQQLQLAAHRQGAWLHVVTDEELREEIAQLIVAGDRAQLADPDFRREVAAWIRSNRSESGDGIPGAAFGFSGWLGDIGPLLIRTFDLSFVKIASDRRLATEGPALAILGTDADAPSNWLRAGQALAHVLLRAQTEGVSASFLNQPIEVSRLRPRLCNKLGLIGYPQLLFRLGYGQEVEPTPRRSLEEVLTS